MVERQKAPQEVQMGPAPSCDGIVVVAIGDRAADGQKQKLGHGIGHAMCGARILDDGKMLQKQPKARLLTKTTQGQVHGRHLRLIRPIDSAIRQS